MEMEFDRDVPTRTIQTFHYDDATDMVTIQDTQDVQTIIETNTAMKDDEQFRAKRHQELRRVGSIPLNMWYQMRAAWRAMGLSWEERQTEMRRFLNDSSFEKFRTDRSRV